MGSPRRLFKHLTMAQLIEKQTELLDQVTSGRFTNLSGAQKSSTVSFGSTSAEDLLDEVNYEIDFQNGEVPSSDIVQDMSGYK